MNEEMMVLRLPPPLAASVRHKLRNGEDVQDMILKFIDTKQALGLGRATTAYAVICLGGWQWFPWEAGEAGVCLRGRQWFVCENH